MNRLAVIVLCVISAVLGIVIGRLFDSEERGESKRPVFQPPASLPSAQPDATESVEVKGPDFEETIALLQDEDRSTFLEMLEVDLAIASLSEAEIERAVKMLKPNAGTQKNDEREVLEQMRRLITYWAELNPKAALRFVETLDDKPRRGLLSNVVSVWAKIYPDEALAYVQSTEDEKDRNAMLQSVSMAISNSDPARAIELMTLFPKPKGQHSYSWSHSKAVVIKEWLEVDEDAALDYAYSIPNTRNRKRVLQSLAGMIVQDDPTLALALAADADDTWFNATGNVISNWASYDDEAAWSYLQSLSEGRRKSRITNRYFSQIGQDNPQEAITKIQSTLTGQSREGSLSTVISNWIRSDFDAASTYISSMTPHERNTIINRISYSLGDSDTDPEVAIAWVMENAGGRARSDSMRSIIDRLSQKDPGKAMEMLDSIPYGQAYSNAVRSLASNWARQDPESAYSWIDSLPQGPERENAFRSFAGRAAELDADRAFLITTQMPEGQERTNMLNQIASAKAKSDPQATANWVMSFPDENLRNSAMRNVVYAWAERDPRAAAQYLQTSGANLKDDTYNQLATRWAQNDPYAAADWALTLPEDKAGRAIGGVANSWLDHDMYAASEWVSTLPQGNVRQKAVESLVNKVYRVEPDAAFDWALELENENQRKNATRRIAYEWKKRNVEAARNLVNSSTLPEEEKKTLLEQLK